MAVRVNRSVPPRDIEQRLNEGLKWLHRPHETGGAKDDFALAHILSRPGIFRRAMDPRGAARTGAARFLWVQGGRPIDQDIASRVRLEMGSDAPSKATTA
jgi:hypothetical protein